MMHNLAETIFQDLCELGQFLAKTFDFSDEFSGFFWFFDLSPTLNSSKKNLQNQFQKFYMFWKATDLIRAFRQS